MQNVVPALRITDYEESKEFYVGRLGFEILWEHRFESEYPVFMQIHQEDLNLYLTEHAGDAEPESLVYLYVPDVNTWYKRCLEHGIVVDPPEDKPWGNRQLRVFDPDGNRLIFASKIS